MAKKVTTDDILKMNELYYKYHTYAQVAREIGFSASTVSKYVDKNWKPIKIENLKHFTISMLPDFTADMFVGVENYGDLCVLTDQEKEEIKELWGELAI